MVELCPEKSDNIDEYRAVSIRGVDNPEYLEKLENFKTLYNDFIIEVKGTETLDNGKLCTIIHLKPELNLYLREGFNIEI